MTEAVLQDVAMINPGLSHRPREDELVSFLGMADIDSATGTTSSGKDRLFLEVSQGYTPFEDGDILVAKITPCFENRKIALATLAYRLGMGSTEFHVIRPDPDALDRRYVLHLLRTERVRGMGESRMTGSAGQKRVPEAFLRGLAIPLPSLDEQRRIAAMLDRADSILTVARQSVDVLNELTTTVFDDMFGRHGASWPATRLDGLLADTQLGLVRGSQELSDDLPTAYLRMNAITAAGTLDLRDLRRTSVSPSEASRYALEPGDLLFNTRNSRELVGKTALVRDRMPRTVFNNNILRLRFRTDLVAPEYVAHAFRTRSSRRFLESCKAGTTSVFAIYYKSLKDMPIPVPPLSLQREFAALAAAIREQAKRMMSAGRRADQLAGALQYRAFRGEL